MAMRDRHHRPPRALFAALLVVCFALVTVDARDRERSPLEPVRVLAGDLIGPAEVFANQVVRPFTAVPDYLVSSRQLQEQVAALEAENAELRGALATTGIDRSRAAQVDALLAKADESGLSLLPARVVAMGPSQSFSRTVTIDAGSSSGVAEDMTVVNGDGLVGRVLRVGRSTATVVLVVDRESVVGGRLGSNQEVGFLRGRGAVGDRARLDLDLVDNSVVAARDDVVLTWGSRGGAPYVAGVPIGRVTQVYSSPRELAQHAVIEPFVDFSSLDLVGVVVPRGTKGDRTLIRAEEGR